jgi:quercetin dioxygenase-like cupin family protein
VPEEAAHPLACAGMAAVRDFAEELEGYAYLPRLFDKARARLSGDTHAPAFGCPLDHSCVARLRVYPETVLELVSRNRDDDRAILAGLRVRGIPQAAEAWFDARATEDELLTGVYLKVRPRELADELRPRPGQRVVAVEEGEALFFLGDHQMRIVRSGEVVRVPPELPHRIEDIGETRLRLSWLTGDADESTGTATSQPPALM